MNFAKNSKVQIFINAAVGLIKFTLQVGNFFLKFVVNVIPDLNTLQ